MSCFLQKVIKTQKLGIHGPLQALLLLIKLYNFSFVFFNHIVHINMEQRSLRSSRHGGLRLPPGCRLALSLIANPDRKRMFVIGALLSSVSSSLLILALSRCKSCFRKHVVLFLRLIDQIHPLNVVVQFLN